MTGKITDSSTNVQTRMLTIEYEDKHAVKAMIFGENNCNDEDA